MRRLIGNLIAAALVAIPFGFASAAGATDLTVFAKNPQGQPMADVTVAAVNFGMNGPSTHTVIGVTDAGGSVSLSVVVGLNYDVFFSSHGFSPTIQDQFNNPNPNMRRNYYIADANPLSSTVTFTSALADVGRIELEFTHATPATVLFGGVNNNALQMPGPSGIVVVDGVGDGILSVDNVPYAAANTYNIGLYDPEKNKGVGRNVLTVLNAGIPLISYTGVSGVDFDESIAPTRVENTASMNSDGGSNLSVQGVVRSTDANWVPIPRNGINFRSCRDNPWAQVDDNGTFQLYNLTPGVTYYAEAYGGCTWSQQGPGDCYEQYRSPALVFGVGAPPQDLCSGAAPKGINDFVYLSSNSIQTVHIKLNRVPKSTGEIKVYVKAASGYAIPNANVNISPDGSGWSNDGCAGPQDWNTVVSSPGFANTNTNVSATGYALLDGLPSGNYILNVWTPFSQSGNAPYNAGPDGELNWDWSAAHCGTDDYRVTVDTHTNPSLYVYDAFGADLGLSSITVIVNAGSNVSGEVKGALTFSSAADLRANPIMITLNPNCDGNGGCGQGNFAVIDSSGASSYNYTIKVSSGFSYWMNVASKGWGQIKSGGGDDGIHLEASSSVVKNFNFIPAGTITGTLNKPSGLGVYQPANNEYIYIDANTNNGSVYGPLSKDGTFTFEGAIPGIYTLRLGGSVSSSFPYAFPQPAPTVTVTAGNTSTVNVDLVNATYMNVALDTSKVPDASIVKEPSWGEVILGFRAVPLPAGTMFSAGKLISLLLGDNQDYGIYYSTPTGNNEWGRCGSNWPLSGFCASRVPSPGAYDLYLMRNGNMVGGAGNMYPHFVILNSTRNIILDAAHAVELVDVSSSPWTGMVRSSGVLVNLTPAVDLHTRGNATLHGNVTADNFFRQVDYDALGGDFEKFMQYLPLVSLYDAAGKLNAVGTVIPAPAYVYQHDAEFNAAFASGFPAFKALLAGAGANGGFGFEIMGLPPGACYTAVMTTPNYPSYQTKVCLGISGSTKTITVNLDDAVGSGATVGGVVKGTDTVTLIPNAIVEITGDGVDKKPLSTDASGAYKFEGLSAGAVKIRVSADGYAVAEEEKELSGNGVFAQNFFLTAAPGSISGTVYSQKLPFAKVQPGARIYAYDDTYNGLNADKPVPLLKTKTGSDGAYTLTGLVTGHIYKVFLRTPGMYTLNLTTPAAAGAISGMDFTMLPKPPDIKLFARLTDDAYEFTVLDPQKFKDGSVKWSAAPYNAGTAQTLNLEQLPGGNLRGSIPRASLAAGITYVLHGAATTYANKTATRELLFGTNYKGNSEQTIDDLILGDDSDDGTGRRNNEASMDQSGGDPSAIVVRAGAMQMDFTDSAIPSAAFKAEEKDSSAVADKVEALGADAFAGKLYTLTLSNVVLNQDKGFDVTLAYDKDDSNLDDLGVARYDDTTNKWETVPGLATVDPVKGTVKVKLKTLASVLSVKGTGARPAFSSFNGREYVVRPRAAGDPVSGVFAVVKPSLAGGSYTGSKVKVFNVPNPFNLDSKSVTTAHAGAQTTNGTVIHVEVPSTNAGPGHIRIYTLAGELVKDISVTFEAGKHNYVNWDGRNKGGREVANGVYYGVVELSGKAPNRKDATFKMAVIK